MDTSFSCKKFLKAGHSSVLTTRCVPGRVQTGSGRMFPSNWCCLCCCGVFPGGSEVKAFAYNAGDLGSIPESGRSPGEGNGNSLQYSCLENPMDWGAWWATVHGVAKSWTRLSDFTSLHFMLLHPFIRWESRGQGNNLLLLAQLTNSIVQIWPLTCLESSFHSYHLTPAPETQPTKGAPLRKKSKRLYCKTNQAKHYQRCAGLPQ